MIARTWRGWVRTEEAEAYVDYITSIDVAVFYPEDDQYLIDRDTTVRHFDVARTL